MVTVGRFYVAGAAEGLALVLRESLSFWGGVALENGDIIDQSHPDVGKNVKGRVLIMPGGRGSSSSSAVLAEAIRSGVAPAAIVLSRPDAILTVGALVARSLYGRACPVVVCAIEKFATDDRVRITALDAKTAELRIARR